MDGANADSDHSMTWEDFFGSTSDLTPTLIGIYDSLLEPNNLKPERSRFDLTAKDARNDPPLPPKLIERDMKEHETMKKEISESPLKDSTAISGNVKIPALNKVIQSLRAKMESGNDNDNHGALNQNIPSCGLSNNESSFLYNKNSPPRSHVRSFKTDKVSDIVTPANTFDNLSRNVKRMISSATDTTHTSLKVQKKPPNSVRGSMRSHKLNIPLVGATSKISQSGVDVLPSMEIYDQPCIKVERHLEENKIASPVVPLPVKADFRIESYAIYDVPKSKQSIYDVPISKNKTAFESLSLPYIDQSMELSITSNDREFDIKLSSNELATKDEAQKTAPESSHVKLSNISDSTDGLNRKDFAQNSLNVNLYPETVGSTGNLKMSVSEKDGRLLPPSVEVSRPLSMSSIASSSSTSSSGLQNKGGANSAYLASIESLDDHSDADINSTAGSNNFVNNAGVNVGEDRRSEVIPRSHALDELSGLSQLERVCSEIVQTENVYVDDLRQVVEGYLHVWRKDAVFSEEELLELFNNIEDIYSFNRSLCDELLTCQLDASSIASCFVDNTTGFTVYTSYCTGYPRTMERLAVLASRPHSARAFRERQTALGHPLPLASYLLKPVQRILKYHLLLQNVVKLCACRETEFALLKMTGIAKHIDNMKRKHEHAVRVQEIQSLLYGWNGPDLTTYGELCAEGTFRVFGAKAMRHVFLFDKLLLITKNRDDGILAYKSHIMCNNMMLVESIVGAPLSFHVIPWDAPRAQITLQASSARHKREWTLLLKRVILENYNAVIPSHARQLVMELGQNKTDDDIIAEKSHNLRTQPSMRKQLSAPEYLEKRKLEKERRKLFDNGIRGRTKKGNRKLTMPISISDISEDVCDCAQVSLDKEVDVTCEQCYIDLCSDCDVDLSNKYKSAEEPCRCRNEEINSDKCPECDRLLHFIDSGSVECLERKQSCCKCSDFKSSQESVGKEFNTSFNKSKNFHSSDDIVSYTEKSKSKDDLSDNPSMSNIRARNANKTCLKCAKIKENIAVTDPRRTLNSRKSRKHNELDRKIDALRSKSKDDNQRSKLSRIGTWRRKSEPGLQQDVTDIVNKKMLDDNDMKKCNDLIGREKIEFECRNCGSNKITRNGKNTDKVILSDSETNKKVRTSDSSSNQKLEIKMYNCKNVPKKITKIKKSRTKNLRLASDTTAKFYADFSSDMSTENILHISESNDSLDTVNNKDESKDNDPDELVHSVLLSKDDDIDEETYKKLIEKTDSFKKNELEKVKFLNKQKVINEGSEIENEKQSDASINVANKEANEVSDVTEQPLEQIISQLLMQNREFQKLLKKQQLRNTAQRRHQRLLKSHSNPEQVILARNMELSKIKPKYARQMSETLNPNSNILNLNILSPPNEQESGDDHIYETLKVIPASKETNLDKKINDSDDSFVTEPDYVYLSFNELHKSKDNVDAGIYDVPVKRNNLNDIATKPGDYYEVMQANGTKFDRANQIGENVYDNIVEACIRNKNSPPETVPVTTGDYLPMTANQLNPNMPEIWLKQQKDHFTDSRDRKSGSLPRSFQVITGNQNEDDLNTFRNKPKSNSKTYLNRDGKVLSIDRPFTIASDKSEISYDDVENYMSDGDVLKFNKSGSSRTSPSQHDSLQNISQSTLELEKEIDRCYKNNFEIINIDEGKTDALLTTSQPNLNVSTTSSCEALANEKHVENNTQDIDIVHPEHKIYKPTSNMLSLKNVLNRFKTKNSNKSHVNESPGVSSNASNGIDSVKSDLKSPTSNEKKSVLNPRNYSKNLLQRFRNIIGDEQTDNNVNKASPSIKSNNTEEHNRPNNEIKVVITSTDVSPLNSTIVYTVNKDPLVRSICENSTLSQSQNERNNLETLSHSCNNIKEEIPEPTFKKRFEKSISLITTNSNSMASSSISSKSNNSSYQNLNKLPIYMQGSKHLGARIAQSDYVDPSTLIGDNKKGFNSVNILVNKNAVRPDSLFSNSSFVTVSSESAYSTDVKQSDKNETSKQHDKGDLSESSIVANLDESFYEKSFEQIENVRSEDVFRDSAVYSDQDDTVEVKSEILQTKNKSFVKQLNKDNNINRNIFKSQFMNVTSKIETKSNCQLNLTNTNATRSKVAPPVPVKPKLVSNIPTSFSNNPKVQLQTVINNKFNAIATKKEQTSLDAVNKRTIRSTSIKHSFIQRSVSTPNEPTVKSKSDLGTAANKFNTKNQHARETVNSMIDTADDSVTPPDCSEENTIQMKRLNFERASLDSISRKTKTLPTESNIFSSEIPKSSSSKTVLERRLEIESMSKNSAVKQIGLTRRSFAMAGPATRKSFDRTGVERKSGSVKPTKGIESPNIPVAQVSSEAKCIDNDSKKSWVKEVVNKFQ